MRSKARVLVLLGIMPSLAGGKRPGKHDFYHDGSWEKGPVPSAMAGAAQLRAFLWQFRLLIYSKCIQKTVITHNRPGRTASLIWSVQWYDMGLPVWSDSSEDGLLSTFKTYQQREQQRRRRRHGSSSQRSLSQGKQQPWNTSHESSSHGDRKHRKRN